VRKRNILTEEERRENALNKIVMDTVRNIIGLDSLTDIDNDRKGDGPRNRKKVREIA
jgi:hypothetical protein